MKKLLLLTFVINATYSNNSYARNNGAEAFVTGFAQALNARMGGVPYQAPAQVQTSVTVYSIPSTINHDGHWDAVRFDNQPGGYYFFNQEGCQKFLGRSGGEYTTCIQVY